MVIIWCVFLLSVVFGAPSTKTTQRIINGQVASTGQFPYQVSLRDGDMHFCGGSILNENTILTAAHCVALRKDDVITVVAGTTKLNSGGDFYKVINVIIHDNWTESNALNDIALLKLSKQITFNEFVSVVNVAPDNVPADTDAIVSGWGLTDSNNGENSNDLRYLHLKIIDYLECRKEQPVDNTMPIEMSHICGLNEFGKGVCRQDSGSPVVANGTQVGIVSWGNGCAIGYADVFTNVLFYKNWIDSHK